MKPGPGDELQGRPASLRRVGSVHLVQYEELGPMSRDEAVAALSSSDAEAISLALIRVALHDADWTWVQEQCIRLAEHDDVWVRRNCATCFGHLARLHGKLDTTRVVPLLQRLSKDENVASWAEAAIDDLQIFLGNDASEPH